MRSPSILLALLCGGLLHPDAAVAAEATASCTGMISSLPATITAAGTWCVSGNLSTSGSAAKAITVNADHVVVDCNDFLLSETAGLATTSFGVFASGRRGVTVRHCNLSGFRYGVYLAGTAGGHVVEYNRLDRNTYRSIHVEGDGSVIAHNQVLESGGTTTTTNGYGIYASGSVDVIDNLVFGVVAQSGGNGSVFGIYTLGNANGSVAFNRVRGLVRDGTGKAYGLANYTSKRVNLHDNDLVGDLLATSIGLHCVGSTGRARDNMVSGFGKALEGCGDAGRNDIVP